MNWKMKWFNIKTNFLLLAVFIMASCGNTNKEKESRVETLPFYGEATFTPNWLDPNGKEVEDFHQISPFSLINQDGDTITEKTFSDVLPEWVRYLSRRNARFTNVE